ncbi:unnamed protein product, partial [Ectocarpus sp. 12 AP-2014]
GSQSQGWLSADVRRHSGGRSNGPASTAATAATPREAASANGCTRADDDTRRDSGDAQQQQQQRPRGGEVTGWMPLGGPAIRTGGEGTAGPRWASGAAAAAVGGLTVAQ